VHCAVLLKKSTPLETPHGKKISKEDSIHHPLLPEAPYRCVILGVVSGWNEKFYFRENFHADLADKKMLIFFTKRQNLSATCEINGLFLWKYFDNMRFWYDFPENICFLKNLAQKYSICEKLHENMCETCANAHGRLKVFVAKMRMFGWFPRNKKFRHENVENWKAFSL
jgi:hypothetical protein